MSFHNARKGVALGLGLVMATSGLAFAGPFTVSGTETTPKTLSGNDLGTVQSGGKLLTGPTSIVVSTPGGGTGVVIDNSGEINSSTNRGIDTSGSLSNGIITLNNNAGALLSGTDDGFRINNTALNATITVNNSGTIQSTGSGQALDFNGIATAKQVTINNNAGGLIQSNSADAVRTGQGAVLNNAGTIQVTSTGGSNDAVDLQGNAATINNLTGGLISGARHGITTDNNLSVTNQLGATILGRNGSGVGSDGAGTVVNFGTITGAVDGVSANGDGDGVDIDGLANITNHGLIQGTGAAGVGSDGKANGSEGIAAGGGTIVNMAGAKVSGFHNAILIDNSGTGPAPFALDLGNAGTIEGKNGFGIKIIGTQNDTITNSGVISAASGPAVDMGGGDDTLKLQTGSAITGKIDGGAGKDIVKLSGGGTLPTVSNFETVEVESGTWIFLLSGVDLGAVMDGFAGEYELETLLLHAGSILSLESALDPSVDVALYAHSVIGAVIDGDTIANIQGDGHNIYYDALLAENAYLHGASYDLAAGGHLIGVPEPATLALVAPSALLLLLRRRRVK